LLHLINDCVCGGFRVLNDLARDIFLIPDDVTSCLRCLSDDIAGGPWLRLRLHLRVQAIRVLYNAGAGIRRFGAILIHFDAQSCRLKTGILMLA